MCGMEVPCDETDVAAKAGGDTRAMQCDEAFRVVIQSKQNVPSTRVGKVTKL